MNRRENHSIISELNVVPFVDIVLVILIIFLIVSPTFIQPGFDINLPKAQNVKSLENVKMFLAIDIQGRIYLNGKSYSKLEVSKKIKNQLKKNSNVKAVISADKNVAHGNVIALIDLIRKAGVENFAVSVLSNK